MSRSGNALGKMNNAVRIGKQLHNTYALLETEATDYEHMKERIKQIIDSAISIHDYHGVAMGYRLLALFHIKYSDGDMALSALGMSEAIIKRNGLEHLLLELYIVYNKYYIEVESNEDEAAKYCLIGLHAAEEQGNDKWQVEYTMQLMQINDIYHIYDNELQHALSLISEVGCDYKVPISIRQMMLCIDNDDFHYAYMLNTQLLERCEEFMTNKEKLVVYNYRHLVCEKLGLYQEAYLAHQKYHDIYKMIEKQEEEAIINRLEVIAQIGRDLTTIMESEEVLHEVYNRLKGLIDIANISIALVEGDQINYMTRVSSQNDIIHVFAELNDEVSLGAWCIRNERELIINDLDFEYEQYIKEVVREKVDGDSDHIHSVINVPLRINGDVIGMISAQSYRKYAYSNDDLELMQIISSYVAIGMINAKQANTLKLLSIQDNLTGLSNRRGFVEAYDRKLCQDYPVIDRVGMIMIDLDHFKAINDQYGHMAGDQVLATIGDELSHIYTDLGDVIARLGGEEFALVVFNETIEIVEAIGEDIRKSIEELTIINNDTMIRLTASVGIAYAEEKASLNSLYSRADMALYEAKGTGRNKVVLYDLEDREQYRYG